MKNLMKLLTVSIVFLTLMISGCSHDNVIPTPKPEVQVKTEYLYTVCPQSNEPEYVSLSKEGHVGGAFNLNALLTNVRMMKSHQDSLKATVDCYEAQTKEKGEPIE